MNHMIKILASTIIILSQTIFVQCAKADSSLAYKFLHQQIASSNSFKNKETRKYVLKWLEQDKNYPHKIATSYCQDRRSGISESQIIREMVFQSMERESSKGWSVSRLDAYRTIEVSAMGFGLYHYCPEFKPTPEELIVRVRHLLRK